MRRDISQSEFAEQLASFAHTAFRLELQGAYREAGETEAVERYHAGDPIEPAEDPGLAAWFEQVRRQVREGKRVERVRVQDEPPTPYQQWERWLGAWNIAAGERLCYLTRSQAHKIGLLPAVGHTDWWLLDSSRLILMSFDDEGNRLGDELVTDPTIVVQACAWRDLAVHHSTLDKLQHAAA